MAKVYVLCGKIASGKSFHAKILKKETNGIILSVDDFLLKLSDSCLGNQHDDIARRCELYLFELAEQLIANNINVIIDYGFWSKKERKHVKEFFHHKNIKVELYYVKVSEEKRLAQLRNRNQRLLEMIEKGHKERVYLIDEDLCKKLDLKFEEPSQQEVDGIISNIDSN